MPGIDVFEKDNRLVTKIDLPGMKKEDVKVEVTDGRLTISGERRTEVEEKKEQFFRCERAFGSFYRSVPLPDGVKFDDVKATLRMACSRSASPCRHRSRLRSGRWRSRTATNP